MLTFFSVLFCVSITKAKQSSRQGEARAVDLPAIWPLAFWCSAATWFFKMLFCKHVRFSCVTTAYLLTDLLTWLACIRGKWHLPWSVETDESVSLMIRVSSRMLIAFRNLLSREASTMFCVWIMNTSIPDSWLYENAEVVDCDLLLVVGSRSSVLNFGTPLSVGNAKLSNSVK